MSDEQELRDFVSKLSEANKAIDDKINEIAEHSRAVRQELEDERNRLD